MDTAKTRTAPAADITTAALSFFFFDILALSIKGGAKRQAGPVEHVFPRFALVVQQPNTRDKKKADVVGCPEAINHVGLLTDELPGKPGHPSINHPTRGRVSHVDPSSWQLNLTAMPAG